MQLGSVRQQPNEVLSYTVDYTEAGEHEAAIYDGGRLEPGMGFTGPAIVEDPGDTIVVMPGMPCCVDAYGNIHIQTGA